MRLGLGICALFVAGACSSSATPSAGTSLGSSGSSGNFIPVLVSSEVAVGQNRLLFTIIDGQNRVLAASDLEVDIRFAAPTSADCTVPQGSPSFLQVTEGQGLYRVNVTFDCPGDWDGDVVGHLSSGDRSARVTFSVSEAWSTPAIGEIAPASQTPTASSSEDIALISTDDDPDPDFYDSTVADALATDRPFVVVFATPAFCRTRACGPTLDLVKDAAPTYKDRITFIHVEPYELEVRDGVLQPALTAEGGLQSVPSVIEWGLRSEPFVFAVGSDGLVAASFEGVAAEDELAQAFEAIAGGG